MPGHTTRRTFLATTTSTVVMSGAGASAQQPTIDAELAKRNRDMADLMISEFKLDPVNRGLGNTTAPIIGGDNTRPGKIQAARDMIKGQPGYRYFQWPDQDSETFDYGHIVQMGAEVQADGGAKLNTSLTADEFDVTPTLLRRMMAANFFDESLDVAHAGYAKAGRRVVVALRGAQIVSGADGKTGAIRLREARPNHREPLCVFIAWLRSEDGASDLVSAYSGSTVPSEIYLALHQTTPENNNLRASMMPQGLHLRVVGNMNLPKTVHANTLRQHSRTPVIRERNRNNSSFKVGVSTWDPDVSGMTAEIVGAHIHAAFWGNDPLWKYSSAGCQVINGVVTNNVASGEIAEFYKAMDIPVATKSDGGSYTSAKYGVVYPLALLSGREARLHAQGANLLAMRRVRIGSSVKIVGLSNEAKAAIPIAQIQNRLRVSQDGRFGPTGLLKLVELQADRQHHANPFPDGVITPAFAQRVWQISLG